MEVEGLPEVHIVDFEKPKELADLISHYYAFILPATSRALERYMQTKSALYLALLSKTISLISFGISFTPFRRQLKHFITHLQRTFAAHTHASSKHS